MKIDFGSAVAAAFLASVAGMPVYPEVALGGCEGEDHFAAFGNAFAGGFVGPEGQHFCRMEDGEFTFMVNGKCTDEVIDCEQRTSTVGDARVAPPSMEQPPAQLGGPTYFEQRIANAEATRDGRAVPYPMGPVQKFDNLVIMMRFADHNESTVPPLEDFESLFNSMEYTPVAPTGSVRNFYYNQSGGILDLYSTLTGWIDVDITEAEAAGPNCPVNSTRCCHGTCDDAEPKPRLHEAIIQAVERWDALEPAEWGYEGTREDFRAQFDKDGDGMIDTFTVVHSGKGAESIGGAGVSKTWIWSHKWNFTAPYKAEKTDLTFFNYNLNPGQWHEGDRTNPNITNSDVQISRLGVIAHEIGHFLGLPDLYDTDSSSFGIHCYGLMANSWGVDSSQQYPPSFSAPSKKLLGWLSTTDLLEPTKLPIFDETRKFTSTHPLEAVQLSNKAYTIQLTATEYFVIENRQPLFTDSQLIGGVLIWHVEEERLRINDYENNIRSNSVEIDPYEPSTWVDRHPSVRLVQPDGHFDLELWISNPRYNLTDVDWSRYRYRQDAGDFWPFNGVELSDDLLPFPNVNTYAKAAAGLRSGITVKDFGALDDSNMTMTFTFEYDPAAITTSAPTVSPTAAPSVEGPASPTAAPTVEEVAESTGLSGGAVAGIAIGALIVGAAGVFMVMRANTKEEESSLTVENPEYTKA